MDFPKAIRRERLRAGLTQEQLADRMGVHRVAVSHWENGARDPGVSGATALAEALDTALWRLFAPDSVIKLVDWAETHLVAFMESAEIQKFRSGLGPMEATGTDGATSDRRPFGRHGGPSRGTGVSLTPKNPPFWLRLLR